MMSVISRQKEQAMAVQKVGRWISVILFLGAIAAMIDLIGDAPKYCLIIYGVVVFQFVFSVVFYLASLKTSSPQQIARYKQCCWVGLFYAILLSILMGLRQYSELGFTVVLPITTIAFMAIFSSPFIWSIKKLNTPEAAEE